MKTAKKIVLLLVFLIFHFHINAQEIEDANFFTVPIANVNEYNGKFVALLSDSVNISEIEVQVGTANGANDIVNYSFVYGQTSGLPSDFSYSQTGRRVSLTVGNFSAPGPYFAKIRLKSNSNDWAQYFEFITN